MICRQCGGGGVICSVAGNVMKCPAPVYDDENDLLGVCAHIIPCLKCSRLNGATHD